MAAKRTSADVEREALQRLNEQKAALEKAAGESAPYTARTVRLAAMISQMQALQAVQGMAELRPKDKIKGRRFEIPEDARERAEQRSWLMFKADWLEAILEETIDQLDLIDQYDQERAEGPEPPIETAE